ncbi:hypothetical protein BYT27DRAFT_7106032, partial [Phlegmacium glaucopus]
YKTVWVAIFNALIGHIILIVSALPGVIELQSVLGAFIIALIVMGLGTGMFKATISPLIAEQYQRARLLTGTTWG